MDPFLFLDHPHQPDGAEQADTPGEIDVIQGESIAVSPGAREHNQPDTQPRMNAARQRHQYNRKQHVRNVEVGRVYLFRSANPQQGGEGNFEGGKAAHRCGTKDQHRQDERRSHHKQGPMLGNQGLGPETCAAVFRQAKRCRLGTGLRSRCRHTYSTVFSRWFLFRHEISALRFVFRHSSAK
ncbi:MAG: hypothetical protein BWX80_03815 [Candidatus Hydrogenedentes bacterium ADurb.Bin101]|nr:MAG: hypothetical protein BWX80_03815 [Candidatus Hydrogenedentes bacterium ADurb.Bin101]